MQSDDSPEHWLAQHGDVLYRYALSRARDVSLAEELVQETLLAALQSYAKFRGDVPMQTWLIGILKHKIIDYLRVSAREVSFDPLAMQENEAQYFEEAFATNGHWATPNQDWGNPDADLEKQQFWKVLQFCLDHLPAKLARLFVARELLEESTENICKEAFARSPSLGT